MAELMTHMAAARYVGCSVRTIYRRCAEGLIREVPFGAWTRVVAADVVKLAKRGYRTKKKTPQNSETDCLPDASPTDLASE